MKNLKKTGFILATAVAGLIMAGNVMAEEGHDHEAAKEAPKVKCEGINSCKGTGACGGATHDCAGKNECKGKGWLKVTSEECTEKGGTVKSK